MVDYIIVGLGLAGVCFSEILERNNKSYIVVSDDSQQASQVAGGLYNPINLKRFTLAYKAEEQMELAMPFYRKLESKLSLKIDYKIPVLRRFASIEEQNLWFEAADKSGLKKFLSLRIIKNENPVLTAQFGFGEVLHTGRIDTKTLLSSYKEYLRGQQRFLSEYFDYADLKPSLNGVAYKSIEAKQIVFAEGFGLHNNPYFNYLPLNGTKGELLTIRAAELKEKNVIKSSVFSIPLGEDLYRIGATYKWKDKTNEPTEASKAELLTKLKRFLKCDFEVVDHLAGIRPTVTDRRPLVGRHPVYKNMYVLNGLGSRGVLIAPYASEQLFDHITNSNTINPEMNSERFNNKYPQD